MGLEDRVIGPLKSGVKNLVVGPAISAFVPRELQQEVFNKVLPIQRDSFFQEHSEYSLFGLIYEIVGVGIAVVAAGNNIGSIYFMAGGAVAVDAIVRAISGASEGLNPPEKNKLFLATLPVEFGYKMWKAVSERYHNSVTPKAQ